MYPTTTTAVAAPAATVVGSHARGRLAAIPPPARAGRARPHAGVLEHLDGCLSGLPRDEAERAAAHCRAPKIVLATGTWTPPVDVADYRGWIGLLVLDGLLTRTVELSGLRAQELLGPGDVLRPWEGGTGAGSLSAAVSWSVLERASVALLDERFAAAAARWPSVVASLVAAAVHRGQMSTNVLAAGRARRAETRLLLLFWHFADRWGRVAPDGVVVPVRLTHGRLAELACLRRPTVSLALARLRDAGHLARRADGFWLLSAGSLQTLAPVADADGSS